MLTGSTALLARIAALENFVRAYDDWRSAEDAVAMMDDHGPYEEGVPLCEAEAAAQVALLTARALLE